MSTGIPCTFIPECFRWPIFNSLHFLSHPGIRATKCMLTGNRPRINSDVCTWACTCTCLQCQKSKEHRHIAVPLSTELIFRYLMPALTRSILTWLDPFHHLLAMFISSHVWTGPHTGWKLSQSLIALLKQ